MKIELVAMKDIKMWYEKKKSKKITCPKTILETS
jgi:hypothetical protein